MFFFLSKLIDVYQGSHYALHLRKTRETKREINLKLVYGLIFLYGSTNHVMQNLISKLRQTCLISKKPGFLSEKLKTLTSSNYHSLIFFAEILRPLFT